MLPVLAADVVLSGTYRVVRMIGHGGMGQVYEVRHLRTKAGLAMKILLAEGNLTPEIFQRFRREAEITSNLNHPNIVRVIDFDHLPDGRPFLVMELLEGRELTRLLDPRIPLPPAEVAPIIEQIAQGLSAAHQRGIVHRDLKPGNVFLMTVPGGDRELVKLLDFGISKVRDGASHLTGTDTIMGTPHYMSPEQASGKTDRADGRADQFALACIVYEMLSGHLAFPGDAPLAVLYRVVHEQPEPLASLVPGLPAAIEQVVNRGMAKAPDDRFPTIEAFSQAFKQASRRPAQVESPDFAPRIPGARGMPVVAAAPPTTLRLGTGQKEAMGADPLPTPARRGRRLVLILGVAAVAAVAVIAVSVPRRENSLPPKMIPAGGQAASNPPHPITEPDRDPPQPIQGSGIIPSPTLKEPDPGMQVRPQASTQASTQDRPTAVAPPMPRAGGKRASREKVEPAIRGMVPNVPMEPKTETGAAGKKRNSGTHANTPGNGHSQPGRKSGATPAHNEEL